MKVLIKDLRKERGISQAELAREIGIGRPYLSQIESGDRKIPDGLKLRIATALDVDEASLVNYMTHGAEAEMLLLEAFRGLPVEQQDVWIDMARAALRRK